MADTFHRVGHMVYFNGYLVAELRGDVPATIRDAAEAALDAYHPDAIDPNDHKADMEEKDQELEAALAEQAKEYEADLKDERGTIAALREQIEALEAELDDMETSVDELERRVRELEAQLETAQARADDQWSATS